MKQTSSLGQWFTARTSLAASIVAQKLGLFHNQHFFRPENRTNSPVIHCQCYKYFYFNSNIFSTRIERATHQEHIQHLQLLLGEVGTSGGAVQAALLVCCLLLESCYIELNLILICKM